MHNTLQKILQESRFTSKNNTLEDLLYVKIQKRVQKRNRITFWSYLAVGTTSSIFLYNYITSLLLELSNSGVYSYFNLIISEDIKTLLSLSNEIIYALFESLPIMSVTLSLGLLFVVMISLQEMMISLRKGFLFKN